MFINLDDHWSKWNVTRTEYRKQADRLGVRRCSKILAIDGVLINEKNSKIMEEKLTAGKSQIITFQPKVNFLKFNVCFFFVFVNF